MAVKTYNDYRCDLLDGISCIFAFEISADYLGLINIFTDFFNFR